MSYLTVAKVNDILKPPKTQEEKPILYNCVIGNQYNAISIYNSTNPNIGKRLFQLRNILKI